MHTRAIVLSIAIFCLCLAACQAESQTPDTGEVEPATVADEVDDNTAVGENEAAQPPASTPDVSEEIIDETQLSVGATPTHTPAPGSPSGGSGGGASGGSGEGGPGGTESYPETTINTGGYEGAILETQIVSGGGGDIGPSCVGDGEIIPSGQDFDNMTTDELIAAGCVLVDGSPFVICCLLSDAASAQRPWPFSSSANLWNDNLLRIVIHDLNPFEIAKILFYEKNRDLGTMTLLGWQEVQVNSNGFLLLKTELPFPFDNFNYLDSNYDLVLQRANGVMSNDFGFYLDSDGDQLGDGDEAYNYNTDLRDMDSDEDGLGDGVEVITYLTDPLNPDTDGDGRLDGEEVFTYNTDPNTPDSEETSLDSDGDGLSDEEEESSYFTDPNNPDSDGDDRSDGDEVFLLDTDPLDPMNVDDITQVTYQGGGQFVQQAGTEWIEYSNDGEFIFQENGRDAWSIYLYDASRDLNIQLDLWTGEVKCSSQDCTGVLYLIEGVSRGEGCEPDLGCG